MNRQRYEIGRNWESNENQSDECIRRRQPECQISVPDSLQFEWLKDNAESTTSTFASFYGSHPILQTACEQVPALRELPSLFHSPENHLYHPRGNRENGETFTLQVIVRTGTASYGAGSIERQTQSPSLFRQRRKIRKKGPQV